MSLLSKEDPYLAIAALAVAIAHEDPEDPAVIKMKQLLTWLQLQRDKFD